MRAADADWIADFLARERLPESYRRTLETVARPLAETVIAGRADRGGLFVLGVCGPQASGKSTLTVAVDRFLSLAGLKVARLSLDDLYLTRAERARLAAEVHPLFATRGPPGTHDVDLGLGLIEALARPGVTALPRFDKARDDRAPAPQWPRIEGPCDVLLFEGWCVGARPQPEAALAAPVNALERDADPDGVWRGCVNAALAGPYQALFARVDHLVLLAPRGFEVVVGWRQEQERKLRDRLAAEGQPPSRAMSDAQVADFVQLYERLTRHILATMPAYADQVVTLAEDRTPSLA